MEKSWVKSIIGIVSLGLVFIAVYAVRILDIGSVSYTQLSESQAVASNTPTMVQEQPIPQWPLSLDTKEYDSRILALADFVKPPATTTVVTHIGTTTKTSVVVVPSPLVYSSSTNVTVSGKKWPTAAPYPQGGAVLPFSRILAYYGNFYSTRMGILGEFEPNEVLRRLASTSAEWEKADPTTPVLPAVEYIAMVAQGSAGADGMYRSVMPDSEIDKAYDLAKQAHGVLILDIQIGLSPLKQELPKFKKYLERPDVYLAIDPEFSMKYGQRPGTVIGTFDAEDINYTINWLADIVTENKLPPKVLIVHRFTQDMITHAALIAPKSEVQVVIDMDGWGPKDLKYGTYNGVVAPEPVQFTGIKLFYGNDRKAPSTGILTPQEVLALHPKPIYIQYQ